MARTLRVINAIDPNEGEGYIIESTSPTSPVSWTEHQYGLTDAIEFAVKMMRPGDWLVVKANLPGGR